MKRRTGSNRQRLIEDELLGKLLALLFRYRGVVRVTILRNIALVSHALVTVLGGVSSQIMLSILLRLFWSVFNLFVWKGFMVGVVKDGYG